MSLTKKDPSLRVAANDPHLVSLGGGRLSTAVTIHNIPIGDTTIGSSSNCNISLNGVGIQPVHCTIYRSETNEVTIVPEHNARVLLDGQHIATDTNLTQGAMLTIGNYNLLRFNNPAEAQMMRSALGTDTENTQMDYSAQQRNSGKSLDSHGSSASMTHAELRQSLEIESFYETNIDPMYNGLPELGKATNADKPLKHMPPIDINGLQCPKVFTADLVTVNMPAKDVLGQKYASFAKNLAENHRGEKQVINNNLRNNQQVNNNVKSNIQGIGNQPGNYVNIPSTSNYIQNSNLHTAKTNGNSTEYLTKVNNTTPLRGVNNISNHHNAAAYDRYPKPGTYGGLQIYPMNGINTEINNGGSAHSSPLKSHEHSPLFAHKRQLQQLSNTENERLEDMLKICTEYADRQNQSSNSNSITSSPIVQNRIKTNGSLPREKKSPFHHEHTNGQQQQQQGNNSGSNSNLASTKNSHSVNNTGYSSTGYENVRLLGQNRVEINGQLAGATATNTAGNNVSNGNSTHHATGYENVVVGKYVPQSPRTKIRTTCMSPKKEHSFSNAFAQALKSPQPQSQTHPPPPNPKPNNKNNDYQQLIKTFEEKLRLEMQAIEESSRYQPPQKVASAQLLPPKRLHKNINNLTLQIQPPHSLQNSPKLSKKPAPAPRTLNRNGSGSCGSLQHIADSKVPAESKDVEQLKGERKQLRAGIQRLKEEISELRKQEDEVLRELDMEKALVTAEMSSVGDSVEEYEQQLSALQNKIYRLEAQRNATRVMEENQQAKLKQSIEMKQDQIKKLKAMLKQKPNNDCLKEEIHNVSDSLENERKAFEDLEFQYLEEESEWHAYCEELHADEKTLQLKIEEKRLELQHLEKQELSNQTSDVKSIKNKLIELYNQLKTQQEQLKQIELTICDITGELHISSSDEDDRRSIKSPAIAVNSNLVNGMMSQSLFGSAELLCPKLSQTDLMSKSVNENMFYNNKIEQPIANKAPATSTPKRPQLQVVDIVDDGVSSENPTEPTANAETQQVNIIKRVKQGSNNAEDGDTAGEQNDRLKFNLSLGSDDFEVNPLERRVPSQDDIDRISKVTLDAPISTKGASTKIFDSIKEIERNRQLLLAQQGHHVIEHERQKMHDLKKKCHDEARAQYLSMVSNSNDGSCSGADSSSSASNTSSPTLKALSNESKSVELEKANQEMQKLQPTTDNRNKENKQQQQSGKATANSAATVPQPSKQQGDSAQQRRSHPEFASTATQYDDIDEAQHQEQLLLQQHTRRNSRPLSEANSEYSCDPLSDGHASPTQMSPSTANAYKASLDISLATSGIGSTPDMDRQRYSSDGDKRASVNSNETTSAASGTGSNSERKRALPKHQRPLTRYLPIFSPDLNLRHHIETAGHQIALCPHVFVDAYTCRGYLHKLGATFHGWARRWFVLDRQRSAFIYYADKSERKPRGGAYFSTIDEVYLDHLNASKSGRPHSTFIVKTKKRSYHLQAASDAAARIWIDAIITGAQGNLDY